MIAIRTYGDTKNELEIVQSRLNYLLDRKEELYVRYCGMTIPHLDEDKISKSIIEPDKMALYMHELTKINKKTGMSLEQEIETARKDVKMLKDYLEIMEDNLSKLKSIPYKLYYAIVVEGRGITAGIDHVSYEVDRDVGTLWKYYYPKIEREIKKLEIKLP